jgi:hypothetical protein
MSEASPAPSWRLITSRAEFQGAVTTLCDEVRGELRIFDADGSEFGLNESSRIARLAELVGRSPESRLLIVVHTTDHLEQHCARLLELLRRYSERIVIQRTEGEALSAQDCFIIADDQHVVRRAVRSQPRGANVRDDPNEVSAMRERFDQIWASSSPGITATTLGLL